VPTGWSGSMIVSRLAWLVGIRSSRSRTYNGVPLTVVASGRTPFEVFADQRFLVLSPKRHLSEAARYTPDVRRAGVQSGSTLPSPRKLARNGIYPEQQPVPAGRDNRWAGSGGGNRRVQPVVGLGAWRAARARTGLSGSVRDSCGHPRDRRRQEWEMVRTSSSLTHSSRRVRVNGAYSHGKIGLICTDCPCG
jgi:hypothetical protein